MGKSWKLGSNRANWKPEYFLEVSLATKRDESGLNIEVAVNMVGPKPVDLRYIGSRFHKFADEDSGSEGRNGS